MRAIRPVAPGGPEVLVVKEMPTPEPGPGEALVRVDAAGVNPIDVFQRSGRSKLESPIPLGVEGAGVVEALGPDTVSVAVGQRVAWLDSPGSYATHVVVRADRLVPVPDGIESRTAAAAMIQGVMAQFLTTDTYRVVPGDTVLVFAANRGAGALVCQLATARGAEVFAVIPDKLRVSTARSNGAKQVFLTSDGGLAASVRTLTDGRGVSVVYDQIGRETLQVALATVRTRGMVVVYGHTFGGAASIDIGALGRFGSIYLTRAKLQDYVATREELLARTKEVFKAIADGTLRVTIEGAYPLVAARLVHERLEKSNGGKFLLVP